MKKITTLTLGALGIVALASACSVDTGEAPATEVASTDEAVSCSNEQAVNSVLAALAVSSAHEMRRWLPERDFVWNYSTWQLELSQWAWPRCPSRNCKNTYALLQLQKWEAQGMIFGGVPLDVGSLRSRLYAAWDRQMICNNRPDNHQGDDCPVEYHDLAFSYKVPSSCGSDHWFHAYKMGTTSPLNYPYQLKNKLIWAGYPDNPYLAFDWQGDDVKIDPTPGMIDGDTTSSGSCAVACTKYSATNIAGQCCTCSGVNRSFKAKSGMYNWYVCQH